MLGPRIPLPRPRGLAPRPTMAVQTAQAPGRGLQYRPLSPLQSLAGGGLRGVGQLLMQIGVGRPDLAGQAFSAGLDQFGATQRQNAADAQNAEAFDWERTKFDTEQSDRAEDKAAAAQQKADFDAAVDSLVTSGAIDAAEGDAIKAGVTKYEKPKPAESEWEIKTFRKGNQDVTAWVNKRTQETRDIASGAAFAPKEGTEGNYGLQLYYTRDPSGKLHAWQPGRNGQPIEVALPEGQSFAPGVDYLNTGTAMVPVDKRGGNTDLAPVPIDVGGKASAEAGGKLQGEAAVNLPSVRENARFIKQTLQQVRTHPGRTAATGGSSVLNPVAIPGSERKDFLAKSAQLKGQAFLQAFESLKGGGAITEVEGAKAEQARIALDNAQSEEQYLKALDDFEREVDALVRIAEQKAGSAPSPMAPQGAVPPTGPNIVKDLPPGFQ